MTCLCGVELKNEGDRIAHAKVCAEWARIEALTDNAIRRKHGRVEPRGVRT